MDKLSFGYWKIRGLGAPARMMLEYVGADYENKEYAPGDPPNYDNSLWHEEKFKLGFDFPNLPYLKDGDVKLTESWAIYRYIGRKFGLYPSNENEEYTADMLKGVIDSLRLSFFGACYTIDEPERLKTHVRETQTPKLAQLDAFLGNRQFLVGDKITFIDFPLYESLDHQRLFMPDILDEFPNLQSYIKRFESQEGIAAYLQSNRFHKFPILSPMAYWGSQKH